MQDNKQKCSHSELYFRNQEKGWNLTLQRIIRWFEIVFCNLSCWNTSHSSTTHLKKNSILNKNHKSNIYNMCWHSWSAVLLQSMFLSYFFSDIKHMDINFTGKKTVRDQEVYKWQLISRIHRWHCPFSHIFIFLTRNQQVLTLNGKITHFAIFCNFLK